MNRNTTTLALLSALTLGSACADTDPSHVGTPASWEPASSAPWSAMREASAATGDLGLRIERAERWLDRGEKQSDAKRVLEEVLADEAITAPERRSALLALSRAYQALGDSDRAAAILERELADHADDRSWPAGPFRQQLRKLLDPGSSDAPSLDSDAPVAPFAGVLASYFPKSSDGTLQAKVYMAGGDSDVSDALGTYNFRGALRGELEQRCPLCDLDLSVHRSVQQSDWSIIAQRQQHFDEALTVFYYDLQRNRIPARYQRHLPMPVADIEALLEQGKGFAVALERPDAPPSLLIAAPRTALLEPVEKMLASLDALPTEPRFVELEANLKPGEIRAIMRGAVREQLRACYESLIETRADASGRVALRFTIEADGSISNAGADVTEGSLDRGSFVGCVTSALGQVRFPATGSGQTTVNYPVVFNNGSN